MKYIKDKLNRVLEFILIIVLGVMVLNVSWQVFSRYVLANPSSFTDELARYLMTVSYTHLTLPTMFWG